jgi:hypothetical protein
VRWHRQGFRLFWRWTSRPGRPRIPVELQALIRQMARDNPTRGQERIANELLLKLGLRVSPRTVRKYMPKPLDPEQGRPARSQGWLTFVRNHAKGIVACDFCVAITATFRILYVFIVMEHATQRRSPTYVLGTRYSAATVVTVRFSSFLTIVQVYVPRLERYSCSTIGGRVGVPWAKRSSLRPRSLKNTPGVRHRFWTMTSGQSMDRRPDGV